MAAIINDWVHSRIVGEILAELTSSKARHPHYPEDPLRQTAITLEETLEAIVELAECAVSLQQCALQVARVGNDENPGTTEDLRKELIHTGAMVFKQLDSMYRRI